jgi:hypothetical protein
MLADQFLHEKQFSLPPILRIQVSAPTPARDTSFCVRYTLGFPQIRVPSNSSSSHQCTNFTGSSTNNSGFPRIRTFLLLRSNARYNSHSIQCPFEFHHAGAPRYTWRFPPTPLIWRQRDTIRPNSTTNRESANLNYSLSPCSWARYTSCFPPNATTSTLHHPDAPYIPTLGSLS